MALISFLYGGPRKDSTHNLYDLTQYMEWFKWDISELSSILHGTKVAYCKMGQLIHVS